MMSLILGLIIQKWYSEGIGKINFSHVRYVGINYAHDSIIYVVIMFTDYYVLYKN